MADSKKILVSIPEDLLDQIDRVCGQEKITRSGFIRDALKRAVRLRHTMEREEQMRKGYVEMAQINQEWAQAALPAESSDLAAYEALLAECD